jgi:hypothetical protein
MPGKGGVELRQQTSISNRFTCENTIDHLHKRTAYTTSASPATSDTRHEGSSLVCSLSFVYQRQENDALSWHVPLLQNLA